MLVLAALLTSVVATPVGAVPKPTAPTGLTATSELDGVRLVWEAPEAAVEGVSGYQILRRTAGSGIWGVSQLVPDTENTDTTYLDTTAQEGKTYFYRVRARVGTKNSDKSKRAKITHELPLSIVEIEPEPVTGNKEFVDDVDTEPDPQTRQQQGTDQDSVSDDTSTTSLLTARYTRGAIDFDGDVDWHRVSLGEGEMLEFYVYGGHDSPRRDETWMTDPFIALYDLNGDPLISGPVGGVVQDTADNRMYSNGIGLASLNPVLYVIAPYTGDYFLEVKTSPDPAISDPDYTTTGKYEIEFRNKTIHSTVQDHGGVKQAGDLPNQFPPKGKIRNEGVHATGNAARNPNAGTNNSDSYLDRDPWRINLEKNQPYRFWIMAIDRETTIDARGRVEAQGMSTIYDRQGFGEIFAVGSSSGTCMQLQPIRTGPYDIHVFGFNLNRGSQADYEIWYEKGWCP